MCNYGQRAMLSTRTSTWYDLEARSRFTMPRSMLNVLSALRVGQVKAARPGWGGVTQALLPVCTTATALKPGRP